MGVDSFVNVAWTINYGHGQVVNGYGELCGWYGQIYDGYEQFVEHLSHRTPAAGQELVLFSCS